MFCVKQPRATPLPSNTIACTAATFGVCRFSGGVSVGETAPQSPMWARDLGMNSESNCLRASRLRSGGRPHSLIGN